MKIAIITKRFHTNLYYRIKSLNDSGHEVSLLVWHKIGRIESYDILDPFVIGYSSWGQALNRMIDKIPSDKIRNFLKYKLPVISITELINFKRLKKKLKEERPDVVLVRGYPNITFFLMMYYARRFSKNLFLLVQANKHYAQNLKKKTFLFILKKFLEVRAIITPLKNILDKKDNFFTYIPFVIPAKDFSKEYFKDGKINIFCIGKFFRRKDHISLIRAINNLKDRYDLSLTLVGEKDDEKVWQEVFNFIKKNNLEKIVKLIPNLPYKEILASFKKYDLFVLPSYGEPAAYSPIEAMANKLPVIVSDTCGTKGYIKEGENGYIFKSRDTRDLTEKIEMIIKDREKLKRMGAKSFAMAQKNHSLDNFSERFNKLAKERIK